MRFPAFVVMCLSVVPFVVAATGCGEARNSAQSVISKSEPQGDQSSDLAERKVNLAKLPDEDRKIAEEQVYCAVSSEPLGSMGTPLKVMIDEQPVFICCDGCSDKAKSEPAQTLAKAEEHRERVKQAASK